MEKIKTAGMTSGLEHHLIIIIIYYYYYYYNHIYKAP